MKPSWLWFHPPPAPSSPWPLFGNPSASLSPWQPPPSLLLHASRTYVSLFGWDPTPAKVPTTGLPLKCPVYSGQMNVYMTLLLSLITSYAGTHIPTRQTGIAGEKRFYFPSVSDASSCDPATSGRALWEVALHGLQIDGQCGRDGPWERASRQQHLLRINGLNKTPTFQAHHRGLLRCAQVSTAPAAVNGVA